jgi:serine phosphatase RsbU (regulator of sigma subunit)
VGLFLEFFQPTSAQGGSAKVLGQTILTALDAFVGGARTHDDVSVVVVRRQA